jgi:predicted nucleotidyltransferase component of viral defense system
LPAVKISSQLHFLHNYLGIQFDFKQRDFGLDLLMLRIWTENFGDRKEVLKI